MHVFNTFLIITFRLHQIFFQQWQHTIYDTHVTKFVVSINNSLLYRDPSLYFIIEGLTILLEIFCTPLFYFAYIYEINALTCIFSFVIFLLQ